VSERTDRATETPRAWKEAARSRSRHRRRTRTAILIGAITAGALIGAAIYRTTVQPGAALVRAVFEVAPLVKVPEDLVAVRSAVLPVQHVRLGTTPSAALDVYRPRAQVGNRGMILWVHGGGFISSSAATVADYAVLLAARGFVVGSLDYTLAPTARHPTPVRQASAALAWMREHAPELHGEAAGLVIGGDSAGAQIASETAAAETDPGLAAVLGVPLPPRRERLRGVVLFCGLYDMRTVAATGFPALRTYLWAYTGSRNWLTARGADELSTTEQASAAYPPTFISVGDADPFRSQARELAAVLRSKAIPVTTLFWSRGEGLGHEYQFDLRRPQARTALDATAEFVRRAGREGSHDRSGD
jgi:acetyl esterase/lipase